MVVGADKLGTTTRNQEREGGKGNTKMTRMNGTATEGGTVMATVGGEMMTISTVQGEGHEATRAQLRGRGGVIARRTGIADDC